MNDVEVRIKAGTEGGVAKWKVRLFIGGEFVAMNHGTAINIGAAKMEAISEASNALFKPDSTKQRWSRGDAE